jgi:hypothetical protein
MTEDLPEPPAQPGPTPDPILQLATSFMATRYLIAAVEVGCSRLWATRRSTWTL